MNTRMLGTLCIVGSLVWMADGVRWAMLGLNTFDTIGTAANATWAIGGLCAVLALIALKATGTNPILRLLSYLPAIGFALLILGSIVQLAGFATTSNNWFAGFGWLFQMAGMVVLGILTLAGKRLTGWRKWTPLLTLLVLPISGVVVAIGASNGLATVFPAAAWILLGYAVQSAEPAPQLRKVMA